MECPSSISFGSRADDPWPYTCCRYALNGAEFVFSERLQAPEANSVERVRGSGVDRVKEHPDEARFVPTGQNGKKYGLWSRSLTDDRKPCADAVAAEAERWHIIRKVLALWLTSESEPSHAQRTRGTHDTLVGIPCLDERTCGIIELRHRKRLQKSVGLMTRVLVPTTLHARPTPIPYKGPQLRPYI